MLDDNIHAKLSENGRKLKGLTDDGLITLKCGSCQKDLLCLQLVSFKDGSCADLETSVTVECGMCGGKSEPKVVTGYYFYPGSPSDDMLFDILDSEANNVLFRATKK